MKSILLLFISVSFSLTAYAKDNVRCGTSSYYAFSKCSKKKRAKKLKKLFLNDVSSAISFIDLLDEEQNLSFGRDVSKIKKISIESKNYISKLLIKNNSYKNLISSFSNDQKENLLVYLADCKESLLCSKMDANQIIDRLLVNDYEESKLALEVKDENSI